MTIDKSKVVAGYIEGKNFYDLAEQFYEFTSDEAVAKIREIVEKAEKQGKLAGKAEKQGN